jgi:hypothetical protein
MEITHPKEALGCTQDFCCNAESGVVWMVESLDSFPDMIDK